MDFNAQHYRLRDARRHRDELLANLKRETARNIELRKELIANQVIRIALLRQAICDSRELRAKTAELRAKAQQLSDGEPPQL